MNRSARSCCCLLAWLASSACARDTRSGADQRAVGSADEVAEPRSGIQNRAVASGATAPLRFGFDDDPVGTIPGGFTPAHSRHGAEGRWEVVTAPDAPSGSRAVAQIDRDPTSYRFPLLVLDSVTARDVELSVAGKPISGAKDQAIGLVWRYQDPANYYVVRANALEDNVVLYKVERGERSDLPLVGKGRTYGVDVEVPEASWSTLGIRARGNQFTVIFNDRELFAVEDSTFPSAGKVGLWTKADSVTWFDDLEVAVLDAPAAEGAAAEPKE